jgi:hypothetical protein
MYCGTRTLPYSQTRPTIVAPEIDEHHVLGALLLVALQLVGQREVLLRRCGRAAASRRSDAVSTCCPFHPHSISGDEPDDGEPPMRMKYM